MLPGSLPFLLPREGEKVTAESPKAVELCQQLPELGAEFGTPWPARAAGREAGRPGRGASAGQAPAAGSGQMSPTEVGPSVVPW